MKTPRISYFIARQEPGDKIFPGPYVPTFGHPASAVDAYRALDIRVTDKPPSWGLTDLDASSALGRLIDGPISSYLDFEGAESALRCILLHEYVEIAVPCVKAHLGKKMHQYLRFDRNIRNNATFAAFQVAPCFDRLFALDLVEITNGRISSKTNPQSPLTGKSTEEISSSPSILHKAASKVAVAFPMSVGASSYYTSPEFTNATSNGTAGFIDELYRRIYRPWIEVAQATPSLHADIKIPPLLAILLHKTKSRDDIPRTLRELREELAETRKYLNEMNAMLDDDLPQAEIIKKTEEINESFMSIVPESLLTNRDRWMRRLAMVFTFLKPIYQIYSVSVDPVRANPEKFLKILDEARAGIRRDSRIVSRSVAAAKFAELLQINSIRKLLGRHFSESELSTIMHTI